MLEIKLIIKLLILIIYVRVLVNANLLNHETKVGIIGGNNATIDQAPWQTRLVLWENGHPGSGGCGGSLVSKNAVFLAAHCCIDIVEHFENMRIMYGGIDWTKLKYVQNISKVIVHPDWHGDLSDSDWCVIKLEHDIEQDKNVKLIEIADKTPTAGTKAFVTGWGGNHTHPNTMPIILQRGELTIIEHDECKKKWAPSLNITNNHLCAGSHTTTFCFGDSGGALTVDEKIVGIVSINSVVGECPVDSTILPNVFSNAAVAKSWVLKQLADLTN